MVASATMVTRESHRMMVRLIVKQMNVMFMVAREITIVRGMHVGNMVMAVLNMKGSAMVALKFLKKPKLAEHCRARSKKFSVLKQIYNLLISTILIHLLHT